MTTFIIYWGTIWALLFAVLWLCTHPPDQD